MDYKTAIEIFDSLDEDDQIKDIYSHFGLAIYFAQVMEQTAINLREFGENQAFILLRLITTRILKRSLFSLFNS